jgi:hypothetical protein
MRRPCCYQEANRIANDVMSDLVRAASLNENGVSLFIFFVLFIYSLDVRREKIEVIIIIIIDQRMVVLVVLGLPP